MTDEELVREMNIHSGNSGCTVPAVLVPRLMGLHRKPCSRDQHTHIRANKTCEDNPFCLFGLGERNKGIWAPDYKTDAEKEPEPAIAIFRDPLVEKIGLRNQGATCYMNSLLQVWGGTWGSC